VCLLDPLQPGDGGPPPGAQGAHLPSTQREAPREAQALDAGKKETRGLVMHMNPEGDGCLQYINKMSRSRRGNFQRGEVLIPN